MIHISVRISPDWGDEDEFHRHLKPLMLPLVKTWDATFKMPWRMFRATLTEIARSNLRAVADGIFTPWQDIPEGDLVVPVDDDDWFAPDIISWLNRLDDGQADGLLWQQAVLEVPVSLGHRIFLCRRRIQPNLRPRWVCATNNYVIRKGSLDWEAFRFHTRADPHFRENPLIPFLARSLSLQNRTLASTSSMRLASRNSRHSLLARHRDHLRLYASYTPPSELAWCIPYVEQVRTLTEGLTPR